MRRTAILLVSLALAACGGGYSPADGGGADGGRVDAGRDAGGTDLGGEADLAGGPDTGQDMTTCDDLDGDGHGATSCGGDDCDDTSPGRYPGNFEACDTVDNDCDPATYGVLDADGDGYVSGVCCNGTICGPDCDDANNLAHPATPEVCDSADNDCNGLVDDGAAPVDWYTDADHDGFGDPTSTPVNSCAPIVGSVPNHTDCDDMRARRNPAAPEVCDGLDNDCNGLVDDDASPAPWYLDSDGDGYGDPGSVPVLSCMPVVGHVLNARDCDDEMAGRNPGATEACNGADDNCNGLVDEGVVTNTYYRDHDADSFGVLSDSMRLCRPTGEYTALVGGDCDDTTALAHPGGAEVCDTLDNDCNGTTDPGCSSPTGVSGLGGTTPELYACGPGAVMVGVRNSYFDICCDGSGDPTATIDADPRARCRSVSAVGGVITWGAIFEPMSAAGHGSVADCAADEVVVGIAFHDAPFSDSTSIRCAQLTASGGAYVFGATHDVDMPGGPARPLLTCATGTAATGLEAYPQPTPLGAGDHGGLAVTCAVPGT